MKIQEAKGSVVIRVSMGLYHWIMKFKKNKGDCPDSILRNNLGIPPKPDFRRKNVSKNSNNGRTHLTEGGRKA